MDERVHLCRACLSRHMSIPILYTGQVRAGRPGERGSIAWKRDVLRNPFPNAPDLHGLPHYCVLSATVVAGLPGLMMMTLAELE